MKVTIEYAGTEHEYVRIESGGCVYRIREDLDDTIGVMLDRPLGTALAVLPRVSNVIRLKGIR